MLRTRMFIFLAFATACTTVKAPVGTVPRRIDLNEEAFGGWISVTLASDSVEGEFIASSADSIYILKKTSVVSTPKSSITKARVIIFKTDLGRYSLWTGVGTVSTLSHGVLLILSGPVWLLTGIFTAEAEGDRINYLDYPKSSWDEINKHARFPQGLPAGVLLSEIKPKPD
jgi:hypothetical protein